MLEAGDLRGWDEGVPLHEDIRAAPARRHPRCYRGEVLLVRRAIVVLVCVLAALGGAGTVAALPPPGGGQFPASLPYPLVIEGRYGSAEAAVPIPDLTTPAAFTGTITSTYTQAGVLAISVGGRRAATVDAVTGGPVSFPLQPGDVDGGRATITLSVELYEQEDCYLDELAGAIMADGQLTFDYPATLPATIAEFLSPGIVSYRVVTPAFPSAAAQSAALNAVAALTFAYPAPTQVVTLANDTELTADFLNRIVRITEPETDGTDNTISVADGVMTISGTEQGLPKAAMALSNANTDLLESASVDNVSAAPEFRILDGVVTMRDLGVESLSVAGSGTRVATTWIRQPAFGQQISAMAISLRGVVTPAPLGAQGRIDILWNGQLLASSLIQGSATFEQGITIPAELLARDNRMDLKLTYTPPGGVCYPLTAGARLDVDTVASTVTVSPGTSLPPGFERFPQALPAIVPVGFGTSVGASAAMVQAGSLVAALQGAGSQQFTFDAMSQQQFIDQGASGVLVGADAATLDDLAAPLRGTTATDIAQTQQTFSALVVQPFGVLEAFYRGNAQLLVLGRNDVDPLVQGESDALATSLAESVRTNPDGFRSLTGQVVVMPADGRVQTITAVQPPPPGNSRVWWIASGVAAAVVIAIGAFLLWKRPRKPVPRVPG